MDNSISQSQRSQPGQQHVLRPLPPQSHSFQDRYVDDLRLCNMKMFLCLVAVGWGSISCGYSAVPVSPPVDVMNVEYGQAPVIFDLLFYIWDIGGIFGALKAGVFCDRYGRKPTIMIGAAISLISTGVLIAPLNLPWYFAFRCFAGYGATTMMVAIPLWIAEIAAPKGRAILTSVHPILFLMGGLLPSWMAYSFQGDLNYLKEDYDVGRKYSLAVGCAWPSLCLLCCLFVPESPRYLLRKGLDNQAWKIIGELHRRRGNCNHDYVQLEFEDIRRQTNVERTLGTGYWELFNKRSSLKRTLIGCGLNFFVLTSGIEVISSFNYTMWQVLGYEEPGLSLRDYAWDNAVFGMSVLSLFFVELIPRAAFTFLGFLGCIISLIVQTYISVLVFGVPDSGLDPASSDVSTSTACIAIAVTYIFGLFYAIFLNGTRFFYTVEIFPNPNRAKGMALAMLTLSIAHAVWTVVSTYALPTIGWIYFLIFIIVDTIGGIVAGRTFPDTRNLPLEEVGRLFGDDGPSNYAWDIGQSASANAWDDEHRGEGVAEVHR